MEVGCAIFRGAVVGGVDTAESGFGAGGGHFCVAAHADSFPHTTLIDAI